MNQEFKDRVANLLIDARVNAVLAEAKPVAKPVAKPLGGYGTAGPGSGKDINGNPRGVTATSGHWRDRFHRGDFKPNPEALAAERKHAQIHGGPPPARFRSESTINQDFKDRLINIIMEKKKVGNLGQRNAAAKMARELRAGEGAGRNSIAGRYVEEFKDKVGKPDKSDKPNNPSSPNC